MAPGALQEYFTDRPSPLGRFTEIADRLIDADNAPMALKLFGGAGAEYQQRYGAKDETFARSEEHTSELQSLMSISYAVVCLQKKKNTTSQLNPTTTKIKTHYRN